MNSWDAYVDALSAMPEWQQYAAHTRLLDMVYTAQQLAQYGVSYPNKYGDLRERY
jgi:hypothetical protein